MRATEFTDNLEIKNTVDTSFRGGYDATLYVIKDDQQVAYLQYSVYKDQPAIKMIWVSPHYRRQKIAYRMLKELQSMFPNEEIDWGYTTADGTELKRSVPFTKRPNPEIIKKRTKLTAVHSKLRQLNYRLEKLQQDNPEKARAFVATVGDRWNKLNDLAYRLENELYGAKGEYSKFIAEKQGVAEGNLNEFATGDDGWTPEPEIPEIAKVMHRLLAKGAKIESHILGAIGTVKAVKLEPGAWAHIVRGNSKRGGALTLDDSRHEIKMVAPGKYVLDRIAKGVAEEIIKESIVEYRGLTMDVKIDGANVDIRALDGGKQVGYVVFDRDGDRLIALDLSVNHEFQRQKIATKMYDYAKSLGFIIHRSPNQLSRGKLFWDNSRGEKVKVWEDNQTDISDEFVSHYSEDPGGVYMHAKSSYLDAVSSAKNHSKLAAELNASHASMSAQQFQDTVMKYFGTQLKQHGWPKHASKEWGNAEQALFQELMR